MKVEDVDNMIYSDLECKKEMLKALLIINNNISYLWNKLDDINDSIRDLD